MLQVKGEVSLVIADILGFKYDFGQKYYAPQV